MNIFKDLKHKIENNGEELVITISGEKEKIEKLEKKINAMKELCSDGECCCE